MNSTVYVDDRGWPSHESTGGLGDTRRTLTGKAGALWRRAVLGNQYYRQLRLIQELLPTAKRGWKRTLHGWLTHYHEVQAESLPVCAAREYWRVYE